jgi:hypothetical protein
MPKAGQLVNSATFRMLTMIGDGMAAAVVILVSMLLLVVGLLCLRFSFLTAAEQDYREIGVLKAIGVAPRDLRRIYLTKYALLAAVATGLGLLGGAALTPLLTRDITRYMGTAPSIWNWIVPIVTALAVFVCWCCSPSCCCAASGASAPSPPCAPAAPASSAEASDCGSPARGCRSTSGSGRWTSSAAGPSTCCCSSSSRSARSS